MAAALGHASSRRRAYIVQAHRCPQIRRCSPISMHASLQHRWQRGSKQASSVGTARDRLVTLPLDYPLRLLFSLPNRVLAGHHPGPPPSPPPGPLSPPPPGPPPGK